MSQPEADTAGTPLATPDVELKGLLGMFDVPSFVRRGQDVERAMGSLVHRLGVARAGMFDMVHMRLRMWAKVSRGPDDWGDCFEGPVAGLWPATGAGEPRWADRPGSWLRRRAAARDLVASVTRFNERWVAFLSELNLEPINRRIEDYNRYYVLEKECVLGSHKLASRWFVPIGLIRLEDLSTRLPLLDVPVLRGR